MFGYNPDTISQLGRLHQQELLKEAENFRLSLAVVKARDSLWQRSAWSVGSVLVSSGSWLQEHACLQRRLATE
jgi:hypothetical protein